MINKRNKCAFAIAILLAGVPAYAQNAYIRPAYQFPGPPAGSGPASIQVGDSPFYVTPYIGLGAGHDDNLFLSRTNERSSSVFIVSPGFTLDTRDANKVIQLRHQSQIARYQDSSEDNYIDHTSRAQFDLALDRRNFLRVGLDHVRGHDPRGSTDRPVANRPDKYRLTSPFITYALGAPGAMGRFEAYYNYGDKRYTNNHQFTAASDRVTREAGAAFYWRVMPRTYVMLEGRGTEIDYRLPSSPLSAEERRYYGGVTWEATAATTGTIKAGRLERNFDNSAIPDFRGTSWEAIVSWAPRTYSKFDFYTARQTSESTGLGNFILSSVSGVSWTHSWNSLLSTGLDARFQKDEYQGFDRTDDVKSLGLRIGYKFRRWLTLGAEYTHTQRDSSRSVFEYDRNFYLLTATASM